MVRDKYAPGLLELDKLGHESLAMAMEKYAKDVAEGDMGAGGAEGKKCGA